MLARYYIKCDIEFGVPFIAFLGLIYSIWTVDYFCLTLYDPFLYRKKVYDLTEPLKKTHYVFAFTTIYLLYFGFKDLNKRYIRLWYNLKVFESVLLIIGGILIMLKGLCYWPYLIFSVIIFGCGIYLINCVKQGFSELPNAETYSISNQVMQKLDDLEDKKTPSPDITKICDDEPKIEISLNEVNYVLRTLAFNKFFESITVVPGVFLIIIHNYGSYYDVKNCIVFTIGITFLLISNIKYVYHNMTAIKSENETLIPQTQDNVTRE